MNVWEQVLCQFEKLRKQKYKLCNLLEFFFNHIEIS